MASSQIQAAFEKIWIVHNPDGERAGPDGVKIKLWPNGVPEGESKPVLRTVVDAREAIKSGAYVAVDDSAQGFDTVEEVDVAARASLARRQAQAARERRKAEKSE